MNRVRLALDKWSAIWRISIGDVEICEIRREKWKNQRVDEERSSRCRQKHASSLEVLGLAQSNGTREKAKSQWTGANRVDTLTVQAMNRAVIYKWLLQYTETHRDSLKSSARKIQSSEWVRLVDLTRAFRWATVRTFIIGRLKIRTHDCQQHTGSWPPRFVCFLSNLFYQTNKF